MATEQEGIQEVRPEASTVISVPALGLVVAKEGKDLVIDLDAEEVARFDAGPITKTLKAKAVDMVLAKFGGAGVGSLFKGLFGGAGNEKKET